MDDFRTKLAMSSEDMIGNWVAIQDVLCGRFGSSATFTVSLTAHHRQEVLDSAPCPG
jgi:hypothetical protein